MFYLVHGLYVINLLYQKLRRWGLVFHVINWPAKTDMRKADPVPPPPINPTSIVLSHL